MSAVYLIHFDTPYQHARHYTGWASSLRRRLAHHAKGSGARLLQVVNEAGIPWKVVRLWQGASRTDERAIKNSKAVPRLCPVCNPRQRRHLCRSTKLPRGEGRVRG